MRPGSAARARIVTARVALLAAAVVMAWKALALGLSDVYLDSDAALAARLCPGDAAAALAVARQAATAASAQRAQARDALLAVLATRPADGRLFRALARLEADDSVLAQRRWQAAVLLRPADVEARAWLADAAVARRDYTAALDHADALLRVAPTQARTLFPVLAQWLETGESRVALAQTLQRRPPWRRSFIDYMARDAAPSSLYALAQVLLALRRSTAPASPDEARGVINRLVQAQDFERAYLLWRALLPSLQASTGMLYNGDFELPASGSAFDWTLRSTPGATVGVEDGGAARGKVLHLRFGAARVSEIAVVQTLLLPHGGYRVLGQVRLQGLRSARGLEWRIYCLAGSARLIAAGALPEGSRDWSGFDFALDVPAQGCPAQRLQLATRGRIAAEQAVAGSVWFDDLRIETPAVSATAAPLPHQAGSALLRVHGGD